MIRVIKFDAMPCSAGGEVRWSVECDSWSANVRWARKLCRKRKTRTITQSRIDYAIYFSPLISIWRLLTFSFVSWKFMDLAHAPVVTQKPNFSVEIRKTCEKCEYTVFCTAFHGETRGLGLGRGLQTALSDAGIPKMENKFAT